MTLAKFDNLIDPNNYTYIENGNWEIIGVVTPEGKYYKITQGCSQCGECCNPKYGRFDWVERDEDGWCVHFDKTTKKCKVQGNGKPNGCVRFPNKPEDANTIPGCSYVFEEI